MTRQGAGRPRREEEEAAPGEGGNLRRAPGHAFPWSQAVKVEATAKLEREETKSEAGPPQEILAQCGPRASSFALQTHQCPYGIHSPSEFRPNFLV